MYIGQYGHGYDSGPMMDGSYGLLGFLLMLLVWGSIIWLVIYVVRAFTEHGKSSSGHRDPLDIARERYAKGEITKVELADIKKELK